MNEPDNPDDGFAELLVTTIDAMSPRVENVETAWQEVMRRARPARGRRRLRRGTLAAVIVVGLFSGTLGALDTFGHGRSARLRADAHGRDAHPSPDDGLVPAPPYGIADIAFPTRIPAGLRRCTLYEWCDGNGRSLSITDPKSSSLPSAGTRLTINGQPAVAMQDPDGHRRVTVEQGFPRGLLQVTGTPDITIDQLVAVLRSVPTLSPTALHPTYGTGDLRASFNPVWLHRQLDAIGAHAISIGPHSGPALDGFLDASFTDLTGTTAHGVFGAQTPKRSLLLDRVVIVGSATLQVRDGQQALGWCNDIFVNIIGPGQTAINLASALVRQLGC